MGGLGLPAALVAVFVVLAVFVNPQWFIAAACTPLFFPFIGAVLRQLHHEAEVRDTAERRAEPRGSADEMPS
jgi:hypothetical protein